jgi:putative ABC transport system permease protein
MLRFMPLVWKNALRNRRRSALTILSMAASFCLLGVLLAMYHLFFVSEPSPAQALRLVTRHRISITNAMPLAYAERIRQVPGVREAMVLQWFGGTYKDSREIKNIFSRFAVDPDRVFVLHPEYQVPDDQKSAFLRERNSCVVGRPLMERFHWKLGDHVVLVGDIFPVTLDLVIRGVYDSPQDAENLYFHYKYLRESVHSRRQDWASMFHVLADSPENVPRVARTIDEAFRYSPDQTKTETEHGFTLSFLAYIGNVKLFLVAVCGALLFTMLLVCANTMAMSVRERVREVGVLRTLGYTPENVAGILLAESVLISVIGAALGLLLAAMLTSVLRGLPSVFVDLKLLIIPAPIAAASLFIAALVGISSSALPVWNTSRRSIVDCLRFVG